MSAQRQARTDAWVPVPAPDPDRLGKRVFDVVGSGALLVLTAPVLAGAAIAIKATSPGPVFFRQARVGRGECHFNVLKLRTMVVDQERVVDLRLIESLARDGVLAKSEDDPRITRVGRFLRRTSIDELPQLWNVFVGDMSLIGPRPLIPFMLEPYPDLRRARSVVRPGITGLWQVSKRSDNTTAIGMADADLEYVARPGFRRDFAILVRTVPAILKGSGAM
jgi:lipopolysaccharide/colanic/teichoic acid biosynthesis glycosyltransferase